MWGMDPVPNPVSQTGFFTKYRSAAHPVRTTPSGAGPPTLAQREEHVLGGPADPAAPAVPAVPADPGILGASLRR